MPAVTKVGNVGLLYCLPADCVFIMAEPACAMFICTPLKATLLYLFSLNPKGEISYLGLPTSYGYRLGDIIPGRLSFGLPSILLGDLNMAFGVVGFVLS